MRMGSTSSSTRMDDVDLGAENDDKSDHSRKRPRPESPEPGKEKMYNIPPSGLTSLGGGWAGVPAFSGNEEQFYRWVSEPALWSRLVLTGLGGRTQHRLSQHHAAMHP